MIKVSVIMPVYNAEKYLKETMDCLIHQTLHDIEIICVDDGSTDQSLQILNDYKSKDERIIVLHQENAGAGAARNAGLLYAKGEYLSVLDADDVYEADMLECAYKKSIKDACDICVFKMDRFEDVSLRHIASHWSISKSQIPDFEPFSYRDLSENIFKVFVGWTWDKLFRREFVQANGLEFQTIRTSNDMYFTFSALVKAEKICILNKTLVHHRVYLAQSLSATRENSWNCFYQALLALRDELVHMGIYQEVERSFINYALHFSLWNLDSLKSPAFETLYQKLSHEYFRELGITKQKEQYFWNQAEYKKYQQIVTITPERYRINNGMGQWKEQRSYQIKKKKKMENPLVSVLIPIYNVEPYLSECLNSVVNQTMDNLEIICINDGSKDHSLDIVKKFASLDQRIVILDGPNRGYGKAMNLGLEAAAGEYIGIVEPDDYIRPDMYETLYRIAAEENADIVKADFNRFTEVNGKRHFVRNQIGRAKPKLYGHVVSPVEEPVVFKFAINTWSGIYKRSFLNKHQIRHHETPGASFQDNGFWFQTFCFARRLYFVDKICYEHRQDNPGSSVHDQSKVYCMCEEYQWIYGFLEKNPEFKKRYIGYYQFKRYHSYMMIFHMIADDRKLEFISRIHNEFKESYEKKELPEEIFTDMEWDMIQELIHSPMDFYAHKYASGYKNKMTQLKQELAQIKSSKTWKAGSILLYLPKNLKRMIKNE